MTIIDELKEHQRKLLGLVQQGRDDVWEEMATVSRQLTLAQEREQEKKEAEERKGYSITHDGVVIVTAKTLDHARILAVAMLQTNDDWTILYVWRYGHEEDGSAEAVCGKNATSRRIFWSRATGG